MSDFKDYHKNLLYIKEVALQDYETKLASFLYSLDGYTLSKYVDDIHQLTKTSCHKKFIEIPHINDLKEIAKKRTLKEHETKFNKDLEDILKEN